MRLISILTLLVFFAGCGPAGRLARLQRKHPELFLTQQITIIDTIVRPPDTTHFEGDQLKSVKIGNIHLFGNPIELSSIQDTQKIVRAIILPDTGILLNSDRQGQAIQILLGHDRLEAEYYQPADTLLKKHLIPVQIPKVNWYRRIFEFIWPIAIVFLVILLWRIVIRYR